MNAVTIVKRLATKRVSAFNIRIFAFRKRKFELTCERFVKPAVYFKCGTEGYRKGSEVCHVESQVCQVFGLRQFEVVRFIV